MSGGRKLTVSFFSKLDLWHTEQRHTCQWKNRVERMRSRLREAEWQKAEPQFPENDSALGPLWFILTGSFTAFCMDTFLMQMPNAKGWEGLVIPSSKRKWTSWIFNCERETKEERVRQLLRVDYLLQRASDCLGPHVNYSPRFIHTHQTHVQGSSSSSGSDSHKLDVNNISLWLLESQEESDTFIKSPQKTLWRDTKRK